MRCLGCGGEIGWDGKGAFAYTCPCGATIFYDEEIDSYYIPISLTRLMVLGGEPPHIDYYLGKSAHTGPEKEMFYELLRDLGAIWSWRCPQCRERVVRTTALEVEEGFYRYELHPQLKALVEELKGEVGRAPEGSRSS